MKMCVGSREPGAWAWVALYMLGTLRQVVSLPATTTASALPLQDKWGHRGGASEGTGDSNTWHSWHSYANIL